MTEDEAKTKWCPFVRMMISARGSDLYGPFNRMIVDKETAKVDNSIACIGSICMAWRWTHPITVPQKDRDGYCGLAGRP